MGIVKMGDRGGDLIGRNGGIMGDSLEETKTGRDRKENILRCTFRTQKSCHPEEGARRLREAACDHHSPPARERTDVAPYDVAIELHTSGAIGTA
jgi:hypothetical protein